MSAAEQSPIKIVSRPASMRGEPVVSSAKSVPTRPDPTNVDLSRDSGNTLRIGALIITAAMGAAFAFAVGLKVHTAVASALAVTVLASSFGRTRSAKHKNRGGQRVCGM